MGFRLYTFLGLSDGVVVALLHTEESSEPNNENEGIEVVYVSNLSSNAPVTRITHLPSPFSLLYCTSPSLLVVLQKDNTLSLLSADDGRCVGRYASLLPYQIQYVASARSWLGKSDRAYHTFQQISSRFVVVAGGPQIHLIDICARNIAAWLRWDSKVAKGEETVKTVEGQRAVSSKEAGRTAVSQIQFQMGKTPGSPAAHFLYTDLGPHTCDTAVILALMRQSDLYLWDVKAQLHQHMKAHSTVGGDFDPTDVSFEIISTSHPPTAPSLDLFHTTKWSLPGPDGTMSGFLKHVLPHRQHSNLHTSGTLAERERLIKFEVVLPFIVLASTSNVYVIALNLHPHPTLKTLQTYQISTLTNLFVLSHEPPRFIAAGASSSLIVSINPSSKAVAFQKLTGTWSLRHHTHLVSYITNQHCLDLVSWNRRSLRRSQVLLRINQDTASGVTSAILAKVLPHSWWDPGGVAASSRESTGTHQVNPLVKTDKVSSFRLKRLWDLPSKVVSLLVPSEARHVQAWSYPVVQSDGSFKLALSTSDTLYLLSVDSRRPNASTDTNEPYDGRRISLGGDSTISTFTPKVEDFARLRRRISSMNATQERPSRESCQQSSSQPDSSLPDSSHQGSAQERGRQYRSPQEDDGPIVLTMDQAEVDIRAREGDESSAASSLPCAASRRSKARAIRSLCSEAPTVVTTDSASHVTNGLTEYNLRVPPPMGAAQESQWGRGEQVFVTPLSTQSAGPRDTIMWVLRRQKVWPQGENTCPGSAQSLDRDLDLEPDFHTVIGVKDAGRIMAAHWLGDGSKVLCGCSDGTVAVIDTQSGTLDTTFSVSLHGVATFNDVCVIEHRALVKQYLTSAGTASSDYISSGVIRSNPCHDLVLHLDLLKFIVTDVIGRRILVCLRRSRSQGSGGLKVATLFTLCPSLCDQLHSLSLAVLCLQSHNLICVDHSNRIVAYSLPHGTIDYVLEPNHVSTLKEVWSRLYQKLSSKDTSTLSAARSSWKHAVYQTGFNLSLIAVLFRDAASAGNTVSGFRASTTLGKVRQTRTLNNNAPVLFPNLPYVYECLPITTNTRKPHKAADPGPLLPVAQMMSILFPWKTTAQSPSIRMLQTQNISLHMAHTRVPWLFVVPGVDDCMSIQFAWHRPLFNKLGAGLRTSIHKSLFAEPVELLPPPATRSVYGLFCQAFTVDLFWTLIAESNVTSGSTSSSPSRVSPKEISVDLLQECKQMRLVLARHFCNELLAPYSLMASEHEVPINTMSAAILAAALIACPTSTAVRDTSHYLLRHVTLWHIRVLASAATPHSLLVEYFAKFLNICHVVIWFACHDRLTKGASAASFSSGESPSATAHSDTEQAKPKVKEVPALKEFNLVWPHKFAILRPNDLWVGVTTSMTEIALILLCATITAWHTCVLNAAVTGPGTATPMGLTPAGSPSQNDVTVKRQLPEPVDALLWDSEGLAAEAVSRLLHHPCSLLRSSMGLKSSMFRKSRRQGTNVTSRGTLPRVRTEALSLRELSTVTEAVSHSAFSLVLAPAFADPVLTFKLRVLLEMLISDLTQWRRILEFPLLYDKLGSPSSSFQQGVLTAMEKGGLLATDHDAQRVPVLAMWLRLWLAYSDFSEIAILAVSSLGSILSTDPVVSIISFAKVFELPQPPTETCKSIIKALGKTCNKTPAVIYEIGRPMVDGVIVKAVDQFNPRLRRETITLVTLLLHQLDTNLPFFSLARGSQRLALGMRDGTIVIWQLRTGLLWKCLSGHKGPVTSVCFVADGQRLLSFSPAESYVKVWGLVPTPVLSTLTGGFRQKSGPTSLLMSPKPVVQPMAQLAKEACRFRFKIIQQPKGEDQWILDE
eukprot:Blabericola_migrator_1__12802@NODE_823_length_6372_cov_22_819826_g580_i0_p1_GENE_NODE_823_length_6372_cov_22_819826_g580_i0NODE_823_length_6372_cov_22_819826_g580_i0_p1_ORF_typecomplete_len1836_score224_90ANAPC4_WD40/PF12894_7/1e02ANAPC4_WD40/PF12894_7/4_9e03ANAPC4_WD40/PF12894_7/0_00075ANAPC4_WD40/PF12894_7/3e07WD40/PF00400_32/16WD40/PF00400_32/2_7e02WD40/PF00400_32/0_00037WD40_like/PF17005_5/94WD40_like/PF17005_5/0_32Frtz/PF11768_8/4_1Frtz/PF11768_8/3_6PQQ_2/PF13360_6/5_1e02PQQ_2/PF13360_6/8_3